MHAPDLEIAANVIAENVVSAFEHGQHGIGGLKRPEHAAAVAAVKHRLLIVMPTDDGAVLAAACNGVLADICAVMGLTGRRVEAIDRQDGSVTMRVG